MTKIRHLLFLLVSALQFHLVFAASAPVVSPPLMRLGPGDEVKIEVFGNPDLATTTYVTDDGLIRMPLAGAVAVDGISPADAARKIEKALKDGKFLVDPSVTVTIVQSASQRVSVLGEVRNPGIFPIRSNSTVFDVIALAGGLSDKGSDVVYVQRASGGKAPEKISVDLRRTDSGPGQSMSALMPLQGGDMVIVPKGTFFIIGQVVTPGEYRIEGDMVLFQAIARAGGVTAMGSSSRIKVQRRGPDDKVIDVKVNKSLRIQPGDVIEVKERLF